MQVVRANSDAIAVKNLPDGSVMIVDSKNETVFALNATAAAAWNACGRPTTLSRVTQDMQHSFDPCITVEVAQEAVLQLEEQKLVKTSGIISSGATRRDFMAKLGVAAAALPLVASLSIVEQRAHAERARSTVSTVQHDHDDHDHDDRDRHSHHNHHKIGGKFWSWVGF